MNLNAKSTMAFTNLNIIGIWYSIVKPIPKLTLLGLKPRKANHTHTFSNILTAKASTKLTATIAHFGNIGSIKNGILRRYKNSKKSKLIQFAQL